MQCFLKQVHASAVCNAQVPNGLDVNLGIANSTHMPGLAVNVWLIVFDLEAPKSSCSNP